MNNFTKGEWVKRGREIGIADESDTQSYGMIRVICRMDDFDFGDEWECNAELITTTGTTLSNLNKKGFDVVKALRCLPDILKVLARISDLELNRGRYLGTMSGNDCYDAPYYSVKEVDSLKSEAFELLEELYE